MKGTYTFLIFILLGAICLMQAAFYNGFPIVYSDTSTYLASGFELETPFDRPITYGLFLRIFSLNGLSLWFVTFIQGLILSYIIFLLVREVTGEKSFLKFGLLTIFLLSFFTGVSWTASQIMPDIFTSIALLSATLVLLGTFKRSTLIFLYVLFFIAVAMHMSHILLFAFMLFIIFSIRKYILPTQDYRQRNLKIITLFLLIIVSVVTMGSAISKSKHVFYMGAMVENGIVKSFLEEHCATKHFKLCDYKDSLPDKAYKFIWNENSPFYKMGGWKETKREFNEIISGTLTQPKFITLHIEKSFLSTIQQLRLFSIGDGNGSFLAGTLLYDRVSKYFSHNLTSYSASKQNQSRLYYLNVFNSSFSIIIILSFLLIFFVMIKFAAIIGRPIKVLAMMLFIGILLNAWSCGTFANPIDRLGCKMIWLIPFMAIILSWKIRHARREMEGMDTLT